ncbi:uncharacterized protein LOC127122656 [Lathyrus oleraceus]|uniref:uncharacterized protein LOC127122656 n=1 Tax=Pisum sativum TaxID=3888 RepID=UPI0021D25150|nr:uncharacterized protein LOC127122656 [Pisum sativum]
MVQESKPVTHFSATTGETRTEDKYKTLEERLKVIEGFSIFGVDAMGMCLVPDVAIPPKFKTPDFEKYKGVIFPRNHLRMFVRNMVAYAANEKLMMHSFHDSLSGASLDWYTQLERTHVKTWEDLANSFLRQYKYNLDMAFNRIGKIGKPSLNQNCNKRYTNSNNSKKGETNFVTVEGSSQASYNPYIVAVGPYQYPRQAYSKPQAQQARALTQQNQQNWYAQRDQQRPWKEFDPIPITYTQVLPYLNQKGLVEIKLLAHPPNLPPRGYDANAMCDFHTGSPGHNTDKFLALKSKVQDLLDHKIISFSLEGPNLKENPMPRHYGPTINVVEGLDDTVLTQRMDQVRTPISKICEKLIGYKVFEELHANYKICLVNPNTCEKMKECLQQMMSEAYVRDKLIVLEPAITNIAGIGGMTWSGRVFSPEPRSKEKTPESSKDKEVESSRKTIPQGEAEEFLRLIKKSDYKSLLKILNGAHVTQDITVNQFDDVVANITASKCLRFSNDELPPEGHSHNKALHISLKCQDSLLSRVLVDTGSSLIVMPKNTLGKLNNVRTSMKVNTLVVKAFDGSKRMVIREVDLPITVGPHTFMATFQVMDINPSSSCLIGRPWIHVAGVVTSTLHQRLKFIIDDKLIIVEGEEDMFISHLSSFKYINTDGETLEIPFQSLKIAVVSRRKEKSISPWEKISKLIKGRDTQGWGKLLEKPEKKDRLRLGYIPANEGVQKRDQKKLCTLRETFHGAGYIDEGQVAVVDEKEKGIPNLVCHCSLDITLSN